MHIIIMMLNATDVDRRLFVSVCDRAGRLVSCDLDGLNCRTESLYVPVGCISSMTVDTEEQLIYWADSKLGLISSTSLVRRETHRIRYKLLTQTRLLDVADGRHDGTCLHRRHDSIENCQLSWLRKKITVWTYQFEFNVRTTKINKFSLIVPSSSIYLIVV